VAVNAYNVFVSAVNPTPCVAQADGKLEFVTVTDASGDVNKYKFRIRPADPYTTNRLFTGLPAGTYIMEVIDTITGCFTQNVRTLTAPAALQAQVSITALPSCYGQFNGQIQLDTVINGSGFYQYSLSGDSGTYASVGIKNPIPQGFGAGQFQLFFKDLQTGCLDTALVNITQPDSLKLSATVLINSQCSVPTGQIKLLEFSGGTGGKKLEVKLPNASVFLPVEVSADSILLNLAGGDYVFQLTDTNNCSKQFILNLPNNNPRAQQITVVKPCIGDTNGIIRLSGLVGGNKPYTFTLNNSQGDLLKVQTDSVFSQLKPGTYGITLTDASNPGCEVKYVREVSEATKVKFTIAGITPSTCENFDGKIKFTLSGGQPGFKYAFDSLPGVFTSFKALVGDTLMLSGLSKRADGNPYTLRLTDSGPGAGCTADTTFNIPGNSPLRFKFALRNVKCFGENSGAVLIDSLNGTGPVTLKVVDVTSGALVKEDSIPGNLFLNNQFVLGGLPAGQFNLVVQQYGECQASRTFPFALSQPTQINISARPYKPSAEGFAQGSILLDTVKGSAAPYLVLFNEGSYFSYKPDTLFDNLNPGKYTITVQDSIGCEVSKELEVVNDTQLFIPTLFTPNGDGLNDLLIIKNLPAGSSLNIRNRWGEEVLNANPYNNDWDAKGLQDGTYFYIIKIPNLESQNGWMEIKR
jgi:gliding motility-associated-like protein